MNTLQLVLSLLFGTIPFERMNLGGRIITSYLHMIIVPLFYLFCFGESRYGGFDLSSVGICGKLCNLANIFFDYLGLCMYLWQHAYTLWRRKQFFVDFDISLAAIDSSLNKCRKRLPDYEFKTQRKTHWYYIVWIVVIACFARAVYYDFTEMFHFYKALFMFRLVTSSFPYFASSCLLGQFHFYVAEILERFTKINELLEELNTKVEDNFVSLMDVDTETGKIIVPTKQQKGHSAKPNLDLITQNISLPKSDDVANVVSKDGIMISRSIFEGLLSDLFIIHDKVFTLNVLTNGEYGVQVAPYMTVCFIISNLGAFMYSKIFMEVAGKNRLLDYMVNTYLYWSLAALAVSVLVLRICYKNRDESSQSIDIIHKIMIKKPPFMLGKDGCYDKLKSFVLQFIQWDEYFQFNAIGLYTLDFTFLFTCLTASTTYLVVLLQFDLYPFFKEEGLV